MAFAVQWAPPALAAPRCSASTARATSQWGREAAICAPQRSEGRALRRGNTTRQRAASLLANLGFPQMASLSCRSRGPLEGLLEAQRDRKTFSRAHRRRVSRRASPPRAGGAPQRKKRASAVPPSLLPFASALPPLSARACVLGGAPSEGSPGSRTLSTILTRRSATHARR